MFIVGPVCGEILNAKAAARFVRLRLYFLRENHISLCGDLHESLSHSYVKGKEKRMHDL